MRNFYTKILLSALITVFSSYAIAVDDHDHDHSNNAEDGQIYGHIDIRFHGDIITEAQEADEKFNEVYTHSHAELGMKLADNITINTNIKLEGESSGHSHGGGGSTADGNDRFFEDHPLLIGELTLNYDNENFSAYIGKFNPVVGFNYHNFPGIYGYSQIEGYAIRERVGLGGTIKHDAGDNGTHKFNLSTFYADTSILSDSLNHRRGRTSYESSGVANTEDLSSYAISLGGSDFYSLTNNFIEGLSYRLGYAMQAKGMSNEDDEDRYSVSLSYKHRITKDLTAKLVAELMDINHYTGEAGHDRVYQTTALKLEYKEWNLGTSYTQVRNDAEEADEAITGHIYQVSAGYMFDNGIGLDLGYKYSDEEAEVTKRIGAMVTYDYEF